MISTFFDFVLKLDGLKSIMLFLLSYVGICVSSFAFRYMKGDRNFFNFFINLFILICLVGFMFCTDNMILLFLTCFASNMTLVRLMLHKSSWKAARASAILAAKNYLFSMLFLAIAFFIFYLKSNILDIKLLVQQDAKTIEMQIALIFLLFAVMMQSAIWPFHKWLVSSLNSPTPVSAIMHAGLINGGGFILTRFAPLYLENSFLLLIIFFAGLVTACLGTLWKLMQSDIKRMLACSTMGQMGFMLLQCGLGLFPAAVAHLVFHGMFKAYLFLASGSAGIGKRYDLEVSLNFFNFFLSLVCGLVGLTAFCFTTEITCTCDSSLVVIFVVFLTFSQLSISIIYDEPIKKLPFAIIFNIICGCFYGSSVEIISNLMSPMNLMQAQSLHVIHVIAIFIFAIFWLAILFLKYSKIKNPPAWFLKIYVIALNSSLPKSSTITATRNEYQY